MILELALVFALASTVDAPLDGSCALKDQTHLQWRKVRPPSQRVEWVRVEPISTGQFCGGLRATVFGTERPMACAIPMPKVCVIFIENIPQQETVEHEKCHCNGWDH